MEPKFWFLNGKTSLGESFSEQYNIFEIKGIGFQSKRKTKVGSSQMIPPFLLVFFACRHLEQLQLIKYPSSRRSSPCSCDPCVHGHTRLSQSLSKSLIYQIQCDIPHRIGRKVPSAILVWTLLNPVDVF